MYRNGEMRRQLIGLGTRGLSTKWQGARCLLSVYIAVDLSLTLSLLSDIEGVLVAYVVDPSCLLFHADFLLDLQLRVGRLGPQERRCDAKGK